MLWGHSLKLKASVDRFKRVFLLKTLCFLPELEHLALCEGARCGAIKAFKVLEEPVFFGPWEAEIAAPHPTAFFAVRQSA